MKMRKMIAVTVLTLALSLMLSGCTTSDMKDGSVGTKTETSENGKEVDAQKVKKEEQVKNIELKLGEKAKISPEDIKSMYKDDNEMLSKVNDFVGKEAPNFKMTTLEGKEVNLSDYKGENVILEFMGSWCPACVSTIGTNETFNKTYKGARIIGVGINENAQSLKELVKEKNIINTEYFVSEEATMDKYDLMFVPLYAYVDSEGYIQMLLAGDAPIETIKEYAVKSFE